MKPFPALALLRWSQGAQADGAPSMDAAQSAGGKAGPTSSSLGTYCYTSPCHSKGQLSTMAGIRISKEVLLFSKKKAQGNFVNTFESKRRR